jgi:hypothetical protein
MPTLNDLMNKFASVQDAEPNEFETGGDFAPENDFAVDNDGTTKIASGGDTMNTLQDIYMQIADQDMSKQAHVAADVPYYGEEYVEYEDDENVDFAKMAEAMAGAEADEYIESEYEDEGNDIVKVASEYDAAGRIMARGFYDEFSKLAGNMDTSVTDNQMTESPSAASTPALGDRGLPTVPTNFAGNEAHDGMIETTGPAVKENYKNVLKPAKTISAGATGDDPEGLATSLGGGSPAGAYATVRDLMA